MRTQDTHCLWTSCFLEGCDKFWQNTFVFILNNLQSPFRLQRSKFITSKHIEQEEKFFGGSMREYSSVVEHLTADQEVPGSNPGAPLPLLFLGSALKNVKKKISMPRNWTCVARMSLLHDTTTPAFLAITSHDAETVCYWSINIKDDPVCWGIDLLLQIRSSLEILFIGQTWPGSIAQW